MSCFVGHPVQYTLITSNKLNRKTTLLQFFDVGTKKIILFGTYQITKLVIFFYTAQLLCLMLNELFKVLT